MSFTVIFGLQFSCWSLVMLFLLDIPVIVLLCLKLIRGFPMPLGIKFKILITHKVLQVLAPVFLTDYISYYSYLCSLCSSYMGLLSVPWRSQALHASGPLSCCSDISSLFTWLTDFIFFTVKLSLALLTKKGLFSITGPHISMITFFITIITTTYNFFVCLPHQSVLLGLGYLSSVLLCPSTISHRAWHNDIIS